MEGKLFINEKEYPDMLREIGRPPEKLYFKGDKALLRSRCAAIVGGRKCNSYGVMAAETIAENLAASGFTIVSGLAAGIDAAAHRGALRAGGKTIAVTGCGLDVYYPESNKSLQREIEKRGLVISEYPYGTGAIKGHFPVRNRIISGLSEAVVVIQARIRSGSLITAEAAIEQGRDVYALPGLFTDNASTGCNRLILDGAVPVFDLPSFLRDIGADMKTSAKRFDKLSEKEKLVLGALSGSERTPEEVMAETGLTMREVGMLTTALELKGVIGNEMGKLFILV